MDYAVARHNMVENQIRTNRVIDPRVVKALSELPREQFLPKQMRGIAYVDEELDLGNGRRLMEPLLLARLLQLAQIESTDVVLDIGCGSGYSAAILGRMANTVVALESDADLAARANSLVAELGVDNVAVVSGVLDQGYAQQGPYDAIVIDGAVHEIPAAICNQLAEGGRLVAIVIDENGLGRGTVVSRVGNVFSRRVAFDGMATLLPGFARKPRFVF